MQRGKAKKEAGIGTEEEDIETRKGSRARQVNSQKGSQACRPQGEGRESSKTGRRQDESQETGN